MMLFTHIGTACKQLVKNAGRSVLTMLGIIIGIGSVIFILTVGEVAKNFLISQISQFGTNVIEITALGEIAQTGGESQIHLTQDDVRALDESSLLPELTRISGATFVQVTAEVKNESQALSLYGVDEEYLPLNHIDVLRGRGIQRSDIMSESRVALLGEQTAIDLFGSVEEAVNTSMKVNGTILTVIGVVKDISLGGAFIQKMAYTPISTTYAEFSDPTSRGQLTFLMIEFENGTNVTAFKNRILYELKQLKNIDGDIGQTFFIGDRNQFLNIFNSVLLGIQAFVSSVAGISLVVGGIGIMNIMLVTVKERTKEIGLRKAIGAKNSSIRTQFLVESVVLTTMGGIIGIAIGLGLSVLAVLVANALQPSWGLQFIFVPRALLLACGVAFIVGIVFGLYPAIKAAKLHPIEALRYE